MRKGRRILRNGYIMIISKGHPRATKEGYVFEHILKMEKKIGRHILLDEVVHHKNENRSDNRLSNLELMSSSAHRSHHRKEKILTMIKQGFLQEKDEHGRFTGEWIKGRILQCLIQ